MSVVFANKIINYANLQNNSSTPTAILGNASGLSQALQTRPKVRIGMWPLLSTDAPEIAMGIYTVLSWLMDSHSQVITYRVMSNMGDKAEADYRWTIDDSQFEIDDWEFEGLDDNVGLWGRLVIKDNIYSLFLEIENDLNQSDNNDDTITLKCEASSLANLVKELPSISRKVIENIDASILKPYKNITYYSEPTLSNEQLEVVLKLAFQSELDIFLALWGKTIEFVITDQVNNLSQFSDIFTSWVIGMIVQRRLQPGYLQLVDSQPNLIDYVLKDRKDTLLSMILSRHLFELGRGDQALQIAEASTSFENSTADSWLNLADLQIRGGRSNQAIETFQKALSKGYISAELCYFYAQYINLASARNFVLKTYIFASEATNVQPALEVVKAYDKALELCESDEFARQILAEQCIVLATELLDELYLWGQFQRLVKIDSTDDLVRLIIDELYRVTDLEPGITILTEYIEQHPNSIDMHINLAALHIQNDDEDSAQYILNQLKQITEDQAQINQIEELLLIANDPDFEHKIGQLIDKLDAENTLTDGEIDFLEEVIELSPSYDEAYILLAKGYSSRSDDVAAIEVLLDALEAVFDNPDIYELLAFILRETDPNLAYQYIENGLKINRNHVPLLALAGLYLVQDGDVETAKIFLARAEAIDPRNRRLVSVRSQVARLIGES